MSKPSSVNDKIMALARSANYFTGPDLARLTGANPTLVYVALLRLVKRGELLREGGRKHYKYRIPT